MRDRPNDHHRRVGSALAGRPLGPNEIVHHRDENKANNTKENFEIVPRGKHTADHNRQRPLSRLRKALRGETKVY